jgi:hypothetical protein
VVRWKVVQRSFVVATLLIVWTFLGVTCAGIVAMSGAQSRSGEWPVGATVAMIIVGLVWAIAPAILWQRHHGGHRKSA